MLHSQDIYIYKYITIYKYISGVTQKQNQSAICTAKINGREWFGRFYNNWEQFYYQSNNTGDNENNKEIFKKFNLD